MPAQEPPRRATAHIASLDSLRGIAALVVVFHHVILAIPGWSEDRRELFSKGFKGSRAWLYLTPLKLLVDGPAAVLIFFALSGLVLAFSFSRVDRDRYASFAVKRFTRIWPPFAAIILLAVVLKAVLPDKPLAGLSGWFHSSWSSPTTWKSVLLTLSMSGGTIDLDNPMWSLIHEARISVVFPLIALLTIRRPAVSVLFSVALMFVAVKLNGKADGHPVLHSVSMSFAFVFLFALGAVVANKLPGMRRVLDKLSPLQTAGLWLVALVGIAFPPENTESVIGGLQAVLLLTSGLAAVLIVTLCTVEGRAFTILTGPIPAYLGRISYSLYLVHLVVIVSIVRATVGLLPPLVAVVLGAVLSIPIADLAQRYLEAPSTRLGRQLVKRWGHPSQGAAMPG